MSKLAIEYLSTVTAVSEYKSAFACNEASFLLYFYRVGLKEIRQSCLAFFMELVSTLCFGQRAAPEPKLVKTLLYDTIFVEKQKTRDSLNKGIKADQVRSFLLQLLLEYE